MKSWIVVASAARARLFESSARNQPWQELSDLVNTEDRMSRQEFVSDKPGRVVDGARGQRHTMDPSADPKERAADAFAREIVQRLEQGLQQNQLTDVTVVAPPHFLGLLRKHMSEALAGAVKAEVTKDLTREETGALQRHVADLL
jgi:protein required for attachment to host cells